MSLVDFICGCPAEGCPNGRIKYVWTHYNCGGTENLSDKGYITCKRCSLSAPIIDWAFKCEAHDFKKASLQGLLNAFSIMGGVPGVSMAFLLNLMEAVKKQYS